MRLIDADALIEEHCKGCHKDIQDGCKTDPVCATLMWFEDAPTIDAVPVVRCKDCEHWNEDALACDTLPWVNSSEHANWYADDFCSYGERKEGEQDG